MPEYIQEIVPIHDIIVKVRVPDRQKVRRVLLAPDNVLAEFSVADGFVSVTVPRLDVHTMVVVETDENSGPPRAGAAAGRSPWYETSWCRFLLEFNARNEPPYMTQVDTKRLAELAARAGVDWFWVHAKDNGGTLFYDTQVGHKHPALGERDLLRELTGELSTRGIRWGMHVNVTKDNLYYRLHPEWRQQWNDGTDRGASGVNPDWDNMCPNSPWREYVLSVVRELAERFRPEAFWIDRFDWGGSLPGRFACACRYCRGEFESETGLTFPTHVDWENTAWRAYVKWRSRSMTLFLRDVCDSIRATSPESTICINLHNASSEMFGVWFHGQDIEEMADPVDCFTQELHSQREGTMVFSLAPRFTRAMSGGKHVDCATFGRGGYPGFIFKPVQQLLVESFALLANGAVPMFQDLTYPEGTVEPHVYETLRLVTAEIQRRQPWLGGRVVPFAAVFFSKQTKLWYGRNEPEEKYLPNFIGACKALLELHVPFDLVTDRGLTADALAQYRAVVLPNAACLSDHQLEQLREYVRRGGGLVATYHTSLFEEEGQPRPDFGLADLFKAKRVGPVRSAASYLTFPAGSSIGQGLPVGVPAFHRAPQLRVTAQEGAATEGAIVYGREGFNHLDPGSLPPLPWASPYPAAVLSTHGTGRCVYLPGQPDWVYARWGFPGFKTIVGNAVRWAAGREAPLVVDAPMCVEATVLEQPEASRLVVHLVNFPPPLGRTWDIVRGRFVA